MTCAVALLRGINVGGRRRVLMADLRAAFNDAGFEDVRTYIQSGNVVFCTSRARTGLEAVIEAMLERQFGFSIPVVVRSRRQMNTLVSQAPGGFGSDPDAYLSDVVFLRSPLVASRAIDAVTTREGVDQVWVGTGVLYFQRSRARRSQSHLFATGLQARVPVDDHPQLADHHHPPRHGRGSPPSSTWSRVTTLLDMVEGHHPPRHG